MSKLRATLTVEYVPDTRDYGGVTDLAEMAQIDAENWQNDHTDFICSFPIEDMELRVEVVES